MYKNLWIIIIIELDRSELKSKWWDARDCSLFYITWTWTYKITSSIAFDNHHAMNI